MYDAVVIDRANLARENEKLQRRITRLELALTSVCMRANQYSCCEKCDVILHDIFGLAFVPAFTQEDDDQEAQPEDEKAVSEAEDRTTNYPG
jgi:hypothetical protein